MKKVAIFIIALFSAAAFAQELPKIAVYVTGDIGENEKKAFGTRMLATLVNSGRYMGIERSSSFLAELEKEQVKQRSGSIDDSQISELGRQFGVKFVCIADITSAFGEFQVSARIVDVETAVVVFIGDSYGSLRSMGDLTQISERVVKNMFGVTTETATAKTITESKPEPTPEAPATYTLTVANPTNGGKVAINPQRATYVAGEQVTVTATPHSGYTFGNWGGAVSSTETAITVTMNRNLTLTANFLPTYTLTIVNQSTSGGIVSISPQKTFYAAGEKVTVTAKPHGGHVFKGWAGDTDVGARAQRRFQRAGAFSYWAGAVSPTETAITVTMNRNLTLTADFLPTYTLTVANPTNGGRVAISPQKTAYYAGEKVTVTATPYKEYAFSNWSGAASSAENAVTVTMDSNLTLTANFQPNAYTIAVASHPTNGGTVSISPQKTAYAVGEKVTLTAKPYSGYIFKNWTGASSTETAITVVVNGNLTLTANFQQTYSITVYYKPTNGGTVSISPIKEAYAAGEKVTMTAKPYSGYLFSNWSSAASASDSMAKDNNLSTSKSVTATMIANLAFTANFLPKPEPKPKKGISVGAGGFYASDFGGGIRWENGEQIAMPYFGRGIYMYADIKYAEIFAGYSGGGGNWVSANSSNTDKLPNMQRTNINVGTFAKYPVVVGRVKTFALLGIDYEWSAETRLVYANGEEIPYYGTDGPHALSALWGKFGGSVDFDLNRSAFLRGELLYGVRMANSLETDLVNNIIGYNGRTANNTRYGHGLTMKTGIGFKF